ncbi:hypothetical protein KCP73_06605 [Salmonella enterica subsp. enterica]|nr:hypothetical protein KCP73_06605 [Salmonella enterica subsp. enterica]
MEKALRNWICCRGQRRGRFLTASISSVERHGCWRASVLLAITNSRRLVAAGLDRPREHRRRMLNGICAARWAGGPALI